MRRIKKGRRIKGWGRIGRKRRKVRIKRIEKVYLVNNRIEDAKSRIRRKVRYMDENKGEWID